MTDIPAAPAWALGPNMVALKAALQQRGLLLMADDGTRPNAAIITAAEQATGIHAKADDALEAIAGQWLAALPPVA